MIALSLCCPLMVYILEIIVEQSPTSGFDNLYISVNYLKEQIIDYFKDGSDWGVSIHYLIEDAPLGTAGSLQLLPNQWKALSWY